MSAGTSLSVRRNAFLEPPSEPEGKTWGDGQSTLKKQTRQMNVYDAVAGRVGTRGVITRGKIPPTDDPLPPEEVLFRRQNAPTRYAENDIYFANESIPAENPLPDSDLLKAIHSYASDFYDNATTNGGRTDWRSMDETALIAMGILLEEAAKESLDETGDMVFVEGEEIGNEEEVSTSSQIAKKAGRKRSSRRSSTVFGVEDSEFKEFRPVGKRKKRKNDRIRRS